LDTRKTTPNFRLCEKWAVVIGGGTNHRYGLYDMIMLKDNHIDYNGNITQAVKMCKDYLKKNKLKLKIEVETRTLEEVEEAINAKVDRIMLDNMDTATMTKAVKLINENPNRSFGRCYQRSVERNSGYGSGFYLGRGTHSFS
jgi:nicotinate-nucleotide pyrophosphorylase (carboxylating)